jgi:hypothetical protein
MVEWLPTIGEPPSFTIYWRRLPYRVIDGWQAGCQ